MVTICCVGDLVVDVVVDLDRDPQRGTDTPVSIVHRRGGSAANVAAATVIAGGVGRFVGQVGADPAGSMLTAQMEQLGVELTVTRHGTTGTIVVLVDASGERSFLSDRGAAVHLSYAPNTVLDGVDVLHVPAYSLMTGPLADTTQSLIGDAVQRAIPVSVSASSVSSLADYGREQFLDLLKAVQPYVLLANRDEARFLLEGHPWFPHASATVVTNGPGEARYSKPDGTDVRVAPEPVDALDTTGAGDAFAAGFLVSYLRDHDPEAALRNGHSLARGSLLNPGAAITDAINLESETAQ